MRWDRYVRATGVEECRVFWRAARDQARDEVTFVLAAGFDPRALLALKRYVAECGAPSLVLVLELPDHPEHANTNQLAARNSEQLDILATAGGFETRRVAYPGGADRRSAGLAVWRDLHTQYLKPEHAVIVDISGMPTHLFFPVLGGLLERNDEIELQVVVSENPALDQRIEEEGASDPGPIAGFAHGLTRETDEQRARVWAPVVGERHTEQMRQIYEYLTPDEVCPVLPFPARNPRRADSLVVEHRQFLFDTVAVEPSNFVYADERNPFDLYRALLRLKRRYEGALAPLGGAMVIISPHASKLLSVGALMAAWEGKMPVASSTPTGYLLDDTDLDAIVEASTTECLWLAGEPYRA